MPLYIEICDYSPTGWAWREPATEGRHDRCTCQPAPVPCAMCREPEAAHRTAQLMAQPHDRCTVFVPAEID
jgi:hypothetical protein